MSVTTTTGGAHRHHPTALKRTTQWRSTAIHNGAQRVKYSPRLRSLVLTEADRILTAPSPDAAADMLTPWILLIPRGIEGPLSWARDRTRLTPRVSSVMLSTLNTRRRLSHILDAQGPLTSRLAHIPQEIPADLYLQHLAPLTTVTPATGRLFASLCLARSHPEVTTWMQAAEALGLDPDLALSDRLV